MLTIDGSRGEGGGQILRTALALGMCLGRAFHIHHIRARRRKPGLQPQHLTAVRAAATVCGAQVSGDAPGSQDLRFEPGPVQAGEYRFAIGTAGSTSLLFQTLLPALMRADGLSHLVLEGGTHNPLAPTWDFLSQAWLPLINRMGPQVSSRLIRPGFAPQGGGAFEAHIQPARRLQALHLPERGRLRRMSAQVLLSHLPAHIAERELAVIGTAFDIPRADLTWQQDDSAAGPGNAVTLVVESERVTEVFTALGKRGRPAEDVAGDVVQAAREYLEHDVAVARHLADQLILPLALAGQGAFTTLAPSRHMRTNMEVVGLFLDVPMQLEEPAAGRWRFRLGEV